MNMTQKERRRLKQDLEKLVKEIKDKEKENSSNEVLSFVKNNPHSRMGYIADNVDVSYTKLGTILTKLRKNNEIKFDKQKGAYSYYIPKKRRVKRKTYKNITSLVRKTMKDSNIINGNRWYAEDTKERVKNGEGDLSQVIYIEDKNTGREFEVLVKAREKNNHYEIDEK